MMSCQNFAIIGGSGFYQLSGFTSVDAVATPYGVVNGISRAAVGDGFIYFLPRHGGQHQTPPHKINYRANIWALNELKVDRIIAVNVVGGIHSSMGPGHIVVPDQIIDYTYNREHTYSDGGAEAWVAEHMSEQIPEQAPERKVQYTDFSEPFCPELRQHLAQACQELFSEGDYSLAGTYACTQGPRLETAAEIRRLKRDGADMVGMTVMPEAVLARELSVQYASVGVVVNWAAGIASEEVAVNDVWASLQGALDTIRPLVLDVSKRLQAGC